MTYPNTTASAMQAHAANAGAASAWLGTIQFTVAACAAALVSRLHDGSALAMAGVVGGCAVSSCLVFCLRKPQAGQRIQAQFTRP